MEAFEAVAKLDVLTAAHAEDEQTLKRDEDKFKRLGQGGINAFLKVHTEEAEVKAIQRLLRLARPTGVHLHICHVSSEAGLNAIIEGKKSGLPVTCETTPHNLLLSTVDLRRIGALALTMPPVREKRDTDALWNAVRSGQIDIIGSDHAPHTLRQKKAESIWDVKVGIPGLETTLPLLLTEVNRGRISIGDLAALMAENPARVFKLNWKGHLKEGEDADITVVNLKKRWKIDSSKFYSKAKFSPFDDHEVIGKPVKTFVAGQLVMDEGEIVAKPGSGRIVRRE